jgi:hypothetical protein
VRLAGYSLKEVMAEGGSAGKWAECGAAVHLAGLAPTSRSGVPTRGDVSACVIAVGMG